MEVQKEAQRIMTLSVWKMYHSRLQRGGLRLHRSLQLSLVMRSARELYLSAKVEAQEPEAAGRPSDPRLLLLPSPAAAAAAGTAEAAPPDGEPPSPEPMDTLEAPAAQEKEEEEEAAPRPAQASRKRRSSSRPNDGGLVPSKKARLEEEEEEEEEEGMVVVAAAEEEEAAARLQPAAPAEGAFPNLARVLQRSFSGLLHRSPGGPPTAAPAPCEATPACRPPDSMLNVLVRAVVAF